MVSIPPFKREFSRHRLPVTFAKNYSYLNATMGSTRVARLAGM
jgi:hypothetical protein